MKKNFEEPDFEKTEFEAVAYLCGNSFPNPGDMTPPGYGKPQGGSHNKGGSHKNSHSHK